MLKLGNSSKMKKLADMLNINKNQVASFDLPCGYTCPMADKCKSMADKKTGKITDGKSCEYRCYGVSLEAAFPSVRALHWNNFDLLRNSNSIGDMVDMILLAISDKIKVLRIHSFGDFFNKNYFQAWLNVTEKLPDINFVAYTKVLPYLKIDRPKNFSMVYSYGGLLDKNLTDEPTCYVIKSESEAKKLGVEISCKIDNPANDYNFIRSQLSFAILIHGTQPKSAKLKTSLP